MKEINCPQTLHFSWIAWPSLLRFPLLFLVAVIIVVHHCSSPFHTFGKPEIEKLESENGQLFSPFHTLENAREELHFAIVYHYFRHLKIPKKQTIKLKRKKKRNFFVCSYNQICRPDGGRVLSHCRVGSSNHVCCLMVESCAAFWSPQRHVEANKELGIEWPTFVLWDTCANQNVTMSPTHLKMQERIAVMKDGLEKIKERCICVYQ